MHSTLKNCRTTDFGVSLKHHRDTTEARKSLSLHGISLLLLKRTLKPILKTLQEKKERAACTHLFPQLCRSAKERDGFVLEGRNNYAKLAEY